MRRNETKRNKQVRALSENQSNPVRPPPESASERSGGEVRQRCQLACPGNQVQRDAAAAVESREV